MDDQQRLLGRLPDYLNGHVTGDDARGIETLLESDPAWQAQAGLLVDLREAVAGQMAEVPVDAGLDVLRRRIAATASSSPTGAPRAPWWQRLFAVRFMPLLAPAAMATLAVVCVVQGWMLAHPPRTDVAWRDAPLVVAAPEGNLQVRFGATASLEQVEAVLSRAHARIVAGPLGGQRYLLQADDADAALKQLRASAAVVEARAITAGSAP